MKNKCLYSIYIQCTCMCNEGHLVIMALSQKLVLIIHKYPGNIITTTTLFYTLNNFLLLFILQSVMKIVYENKHSVILTWQLNFLLIPYLYFVPCFSSLKLSTSMISTFVPCLLNHASLYYNFLLACYLLFCPLLINPCTNFPLKHFCLYTKLRL